MRCKNVSRRSDTAIPSSLHRIPFRIAKLSLTGPFSTGVGDHLGSSWCCIYFSLLFCISNLASPLYTVSQMAKAAFSGWQSDSFLLHCIFLEGHGDQQPSRCKEIVEQAGSQVCPISSKANFISTIHQSISLSNFSTQNQTERGTRKQNDDSSPHRSAVSCHFEFHVTESSRSFIQFRDQQVQPVEFIDPKRAILKSIPWLEQFEIRAGSRSKL
jgi:hypothetical protein